MPEIEFRVTACPRELRAASRLVYDAYVGAGYVRPSAGQVPGAFHEPRSAIETAVAVRDGAVISAMSLVRDSALGLPIDQVFGEVTHSRRRRQVSIAEATSFAGTRSSGADIALGVMSLVAQLAKHRGVEHLLLLVHPKHVRFYQRVLGCQVVGRPRAYAAVEGNPAVPLVLDLPQLAEQHPRGHQILFGNPFPDSAFRHARTGRGLVAETTRRGVPVRRVA